MEFVNNQHINANQILNYLPFVIFVIDLQGNVLYHNRIPFDTNKNHENDLNQPCVHYKTSLCHNGKCTMERNGQLKTIVQKDHCKNQEQISELKDNQGTLIGHIHVLFDLSGDIAEASMMYRLADKFPVGILCATLDDDLTLLYANDYFYKMQETTDNQRKCNSLAAILSEADFKYISKNLNERDYNLNSHFELEIKNIHNDFLYGDVLMIEGIKIFCAIQLRLEKELNEAETLKLRETRNEKYRVALSTGVIASYEVNLNKNIILSGEVAFESMNHYIQKPYSIFVSEARNKTIYGEDCDYFEQNFSIESLIESYQKGIYQVEIEYRRQGNDGKIVWVEASAHLMQENENDDICAFILVRDIHSKKCEELDLKESLKRDSLTGLYHRNAFQEIVNEALRKYPASKHCLMMLDIDNFKGINDNFGHAYGDEVLIDVSKTLNAIKGKNDLIGRIGGDEFAIVTLNVENEQQIKEQAKQICEVMQLSYAKNENEYPITVSIGIAYYNEHGTCFQSLYENADLALYQAKIFGKNQFAVYEKRMTTPKNAKWTNKEWLLDELDEIIYIADPETYEVYYLNRNGKKLTGIGSEDYIGKKCYQVLQNFNQPCSFCTNAKLKYNEYYIWEYHNEFLNRHFLLKDKLVTWDGKPARMEFALDVTEKENVSLDLQKKLKIESTLVQCIRSLVSINDLNEAISLVLSTIGLFYDADRSYIFEMDREKNTSSNTYEWCKEGIIPQIDNLRELKLEENPFWSDCFFNKKTIMLDDIIDLKECYPSEYELLKRQDIQRLYCVPFELENSLGGVIGIDNARANQGDIALLDNLSYMIINEISKRRLHSNLEFISYHDSLTCLQNRNKYQEYLAKNDGDKLASVGVMIADINGLKYLNQNFGHNIGDACVIETANIVSQLFSKEDLFRLNGDEFVGFMKNIDRNSFVNQMQKLRIMLRDLDMGSVSIGYTWSDDDIELSRMLAHADELMYIEKQNFYANNEIEYKQSHPKRITELVNAIANRNFVMYLQPKIDLKTDKIGGCEALVRYDHEVYGTVYPNKFIPVLEKERTIRYVDFFMFEEVCRVLEKWKEEKRKMIPISLNFSRLTMLEDDLIHTLNMITKRFDVDRSFIEIEITETIGEMERETIAEISKKLQDEGFSISLDDFGSKYTSMSMLTFMKFKVLKIDRSLVSHIVSSNEERIVVRYVLEMCRELGIESVAEGVETEDQLNLLKAMNCDYVQGFFFDKPLPLPRFEERYFNLESGIVE